MGQINRIANKTVRILAGVSPIYGFARRFSSSGCDCLPSAREAREILDVASSLPARCVLPLMRDWPDVHEVEDTVVVPCFNASKHVVECIESVLGQRTSRSFEVIAVEDGSTDDTGNLLDGIAARDGWLRVAHQANRGFSGARNKGISLARGVFLRWAPCVFRLSSASLLKESVPAPPSPPAPGARLSVARLLFSLSSLL